MDLDDRKKKDVYKRQAENDTDKSKGNTPALEEKFGLYGRFKNVVL